MGSHRAKRLKAECPICHRELEGGLSDHLDSHTREELLEQVLAYYEALEQGTST